MRIWLLSALVLLAGTQTTRDTVLDRLSKVERFAFGPTGYGGTISTGENDYKIVMARSTASTDLEKLFAQGNIQAKCYALVGIHKLNPTRFKELTQPLTESRETVTTMEGCIILHLPFTKILKRIAAGNY